MMGHTNKEGHGLQAASDGDLVRKAVVAGVSGDGYPWPALSNCMPMLLAE